MGFVPGVVKRHSARTKVMKALKRLYRFATCNHFNACRSIEFEDTTELNFCTRCGRLLWLTNEGHRFHNPHKLRDQLDK